MRWESLLVILCLAAVVVSDGTPVVVPTQYGPVSGRDFGTYRAWKGIPYANGTARWQKAPPPTTWTAPLEATEVAPACPQGCVLPPGFCPATINEDCLHVNVFTPPATSAPRPVMVFFAGGAFFQGDGGTIVYDGRFFVETTDVILVTNSYRLGALGFAVTEEIDGNFGFMDQVMVLEWVRDNIAAFGGDPTNVTIFGESAGAQSVGIHLMSPASEGLFHRAIMESNPVALPLKSQQASVKDGNLLASYLGCSGQDLACMRSKTWQEVLLAQQKVHPFPNLLDLNVSFALQWTPAVDGGIVPMQPLLAMEAGMFHNVPMIIGNNANEGVLFVYQSIPKRLLSVEYYAAVVDIFGPIHDVGMLERFPVSPLDSDARPQFAALLTEYLFGCASRRWANAVSSHGGSVFLYYYNHSLSFDGYGPNYQYCVGEVCHGAELPILFGTSTLMGYNMTAEEKALSHDMMNYWANLATSADGTPSGPRTVSVPWTNFTPSSLGTMRLRAPTRIMEIGGMPRHDNCDWFDTFNYLM